MGSETACHVPVVDLTDENLKPGTPAWDSACQVVCRALEDHGCFYALYDKVSTELCNTVFTLQEELFNLPFETKKQKTSDRPFHGYHGQSASRPLHESLGIDDPLTEEEVQKFTKIMWPAGYDYFCETFKLYAKLITEVDVITKRMLFDGYGVDQKHCDSFLESTNYMLRFFRYKLPNETPDQTNLGLPAHTDATFFSILQQNNVRGLELKLKNGQWIDADPSPNMFLVLAGDAFQVWSNDRINPADHRVIISAKEVRASMGLFSFGSKMVKVQEELVDEEHPLRFKPFDHYDYLRFNATEAAVKSKCRIKTYCAIDYAE